MDRPGRIDILGLNLVCSNWATRLRSSYRLIANRSIKETIEERRSLLFPPSSLYTYYLYEGIRRRRASTLTAAAAEGTERRRRILAAPLALYLQRPASYYRSRRSSSYTPCAPFSTAPDNDQPRPNGHALHCLFCDPLGCCAARFLQMLIVVLRHSICPAVGELNLRNVVSGRRWLF